MADDKETSVAAQGEEWYYLSLHEVTFSFGVAKENIIEIIDEGIVTPKKNEQDEFLFDSEALRRIRIVLQLNRDLGVNLPGAALALDLLNEIDRLKAKLGYSIK